MRKALVTGGAGFIGSHLVDGLLEDGWEVRVLDDLSTGILANLDLKNVEFIKGDIRDPHVVERAMKRVEVVFHQAAWRSIVRSIDLPLMSTGVNIDGTVQILEAARQEGVRRVVYAASSSAYGGRGMRPQVETMPVNPQSPYALQKYTGEKFCELYDELYGLETVSLRYFNVFGPRQNPLGRYATVIPQFFTAAFAGEPPTIDGDGEQTRDFTYVSNVVHANLLAADTPKISGEMFNVGAGDSTSINTLWQYISDISGADPDCLYGPPRIGDVRDTFADLKHSNKILGYYPSVTLKEGLGFVFCSRNSYN